MNEYGCQAGSIYPGNEVECGFHAVTLHDFVPHTILCRWAEGGPRGIAAEYMEREGERTWGERESTHAINIAHNGRAILQRRLRSARDDGIRSDSALERQGERKRGAGGPESERELPKVLPSFLPSFLLPSLALFFPTALCVMALAPPASYKIPLIL